MEDFRLSGSDLAVSASSTRQKSEEFADVGPKAMTGTYDYESAPVKKPKVANR